MLDGGLATQLESQGHDLSSALWSARLLSDDPEAVVDAHRAYFAAGAQVATTASYQAAGLGPELTASVRLAQRARAEWDGVAGDRMESRDGRPRWVAASVGPYGARLADGSEYRGAYGLTVSELRDRHRPTIAALVDAGPDVLAFETLPCLAEIEAVLAEVDGSGVDCWVSMTCSGGRTRAGESVREAFAMARDVEEVIAVGVNCTRPAEVGQLVRQAREVSGRPVVVYPNAGERWDAESRRWVGSSSFDVGEVLAWVAAGARLVGGCCRVGPDQISAIDRLLRPGPETGG